MAHRSSLWLLKKHGSVTMEYIIVSTFAIVLSLITIVWLGKVIKARVDKIATKAELDTSDLDLDIGLP